MTRPRPRSAQLAFRRVAARTGSLLVLALLVGACADGEVTRIPREHANLGIGDPAARRQREADMNREWQNRPLADLIRVLGRPRMVMNIPGGGMPPGYAVVYGPDPDTGCIDAFAIAERGNPVVRAYHC